MNYEQRAAHAARLFAQPVKADQPGQKFPRGTRVKIADEMPSMMRHFPAGFDAIVEYTYAQKYSGKDAGIYSLILLGDNGEPFNSCSWYYESQLTLLDADTAPGLAIIERYRYR